MSGLGTVLDRLQGLLGKSYLVAGFFPVFLGGAVSLLILWRVHPDGAFIASDFFKLTAVQQALVSTGLACATAFIGFTLWMMNNWFRKVLENGPYPLSVWLRRVQVQQLRALEDELERWRPDVVRYNRLRRPNDPVSVWRAQLRVARIAAADGSGTHASVSQQVVEQFNTLRYLQERGRPITYDQVEALLQALDRELRAKKAEELPQLDALQREFRYMAEYASDRWASEYGRLLAERIRRFPEREGSVRATMLGNISTAHADHIDTRYGMDIESFWLPIQRLARNDEKFYGTLEDAKIALDFSVSMVAISLAFWVAWSIGLLVTGGPVWLYIVIAVAGPALAMLFYRIAVLNSYTFHASVRTCIQLYRFELLKALHCALPKDSDAERTLWRTLTRHAELGQGTVTFHHV